MKHKFIVLFCLLQSVNVFGWNALGHRLVAQIADDHMTIHAKQIFSQYNQAMDKIYKPLNFENAAVWLDTLRYQDVGWFSTMHYVDLPFTDDNSLLPSLQVVNALWAVEKANNLLLNKYATDFDKGIAFRVILHVVGDIHQPLHAATRVSNQYPQGDRGGNLLPLSGNRVAKNLHAYWDKGAGSLVTKRRYSPAQLVNMAASIKQRYPCQMMNMDTSPKHWAEESHALAVDIAYRTLPVDHVPDKKYQRLTQETTERQIALAGCRLGALLNQIDETLTKKKTESSSHKSARLSFSE